MKVMFVSRDSIEDCNASQNAHWMARGLRAAFGSDVDVVDDLGPHGPLRWLLGAEKMMSRVLRLGDRPIFASAASVKRYQKTVELAVHAGRPDVLLCSQPFLLGSASLPSTVWVVLHNDAPVSGLLRMGQYLDGWAPAAVENLIEAERRAVVRANRIYVTGEWAKQEYLDNYDGAGGKVDVLPIGANIDEGWWPLAGAPGVPLGGTKVLFYGGDWKRKGGDLVVDVIRRLRAAGSDTELVVVGPKTEPTSASWLHWYGPLDKAKRSDAGRIRAVMADCRVHLLPTTADCSPAAIPEMASLGVPTIATDVGGIRDTIIDGVTGFVVPRDATVSDWSQLVGRLLEDEGELLRLRQAAWSDYHRRLRWSVLVRTMVSTSPAGR